MLKQLLNADLRASKKYQRQFSEGDSEQRLRVLNQISEAKAAGTISHIDSELQQLFNSSLACEEDTDVKIALSAWADDLDALASMLSDDTTARAAARRLIEVAPVNSPLSDNPWVLAERFNSAPADQVRALARIAKTSEHMATLALRASMDDLAFILDQPLLLSEQGLIALEKTSRGRNKACHRHARERLEAIKKGRQSLEHAQQRLHELDENIAKIIAQQQRERPDLEELIRHRTRLRLLAEKRAGITNELSTSFENLQRIGGATAFPPIPETPLAGFDLTVPDLKENRYQRVIDTLALIFYEIEKHDVGIEQATSVLQQTNESWRTPQVDYSPSKAQQQTFDQLSARLDRYIGKLATLQSIAADLPMPLQPLAAEAIAGASTESTKQRQQWLQRATQELKKLAWPGDLPLPKRVQTLQTAVTKTKQEVAQLTEQQITARQRLKDFVTDAHAQITNGRLKQATQSLAQARKLQKLGYRDRDSEINTLSHKLAELSDWQNFATEPKRQALLDSLQSLVDQPLAPPDQAERLKLLRRQWNGLGPLRHGSRTEQTHFDALAEQAFAPCKVYFAEQAERRKSNLQQRQKLCEQLSELTSQEHWQQIPVQKLEVISRQARTEWQSHHPCDRRTLKPIEERFEALQTQLHEHIRRCKKTNLENKQKIIEDAKALMTVDSNKEATQQAKQLQQRWQKIGPAPQQAERRLWNAFRSACDEIFQRSAAAYKADQDTLAAQQSILAAALDEFEQLHGSGDLTDLRAKYQAIEDQAASLKLTAATRRRLDAAQQTLKDLTLSAKKVQKQQRLDQWQLWDIQISAAEQSGEHLEPPHPVFAARCRNAATSEDLHHLTLEAEIAADVASPIDDRQARMSLQVALMNKGLNNMGLVDNQQLIERWCASGPKCPSDESLRTRFFTALAHRL